MFEHYRIEVDTPFGWTTHDARFDKLAEAVEWTLNNVDSDWGIYFNPIMLKHVYLRC